MNDAHVIVVANTFTPARISSSAGDCLEVRQIGGGGCRVVSPPEFYRIDGDLLIVEGRERRRQRSVLRPDQFEG